jgi:hypothetical protein
MCIQRDQGSLRDAQEDHIDLDRHFAEFDPKLKGEAGDYSFWLANIVGTKSWSDLLNQRCTVVVAEAGNGKTAEMQDRTRKLRAAGAHAFFCRLDVHRQLWLLTFLTRTGGP